jgi:hypothetical protein
MERLAHSGVSADHAPGCGCEIVSVHQPRGGKCRTLWHQERRRAAAVGALCSSDMVAGEAVTDAMLAEDGNEPTAVRPRAFAHRR